MPQKEKKWWVPTDWGEEQALRVAQEVRRLRGSRSAQWLADQTAELGHPVSRSVIADLENGRRRYVTTAELVILAVALNTTPIALMYPGPYRETIQAMPNLEVPGIWAVQWFSGKIHTTSDRPFADDGEFIQAPNPDEYNNNLRRLQRAYQMWDLDERRKALRVQLEVQRYRKRHGRDVDDDEISHLVDDIADIQRRIDELRGQDGG